jgi:hypothetical protein
MENPRYNEIKGQIQVLHAQLSALWMQPGGSKNVDPSEAVSIATAVLSDLESLVSSTRFNIARHAENRVKPKNRPNPKRGKHDLAQTAFSGFQKATGVKVHSQRHSRSGRGK